MTDGVRLLYVEDEPAVREATARSLREHGFRVTTAETAAEGLARWEAERADLLITTDPHLLNVSELKTLRPSQYR